MIKYAVCEGKITKDPFYGYIAKRSVAKQKYLTSEELSRIMETPFDNSSLYLTRDVFLFACFTGLSFTDVRNLTVQNVIKAEDGVIWIKTSRQKTGVPCNIPLLDIPTKIIEKYQGLGKDGRLLVVGSNSGINGNLKKIAKVCELNRNLTFHMARHTFATHFTLAQGVSIATISKLMGHTSEETTQIYAKITNRKVNQDMKKLSESINGKYTLLEEKKSA